MRCHPVCLLPALLIVIAPVLSPAVAGAQPPDPTTVGQPRPGPGPQPNQGVMRPARPGMPPRDAVNPNDPATASIRGRVTDEHGQPLRRTAISAFAAQGRQGRSALTNEDGRFEITAIPAGRYSVTAAKAGYVRQMFGQRPGQVMGGRPIEVAVGQSVDKVDFALLRGGVITGRVVDDVGDPAAEISVVPMRFQTMRGVKRLGPAGRPFITDDTGRFRLWGLPPGDYFVAAQGRGPMGMGMGMNMDTGPGGPEPGYIQTFSPGTASAGEATRYTVVAGEEISADIQLVLSKMVRISGTVVSSTGQPVPGGFIRLVSRGEVTQDLPGGSIGEGGKFVLHAVPPGSYVLTTRTGEGFMGPPREGGNTGEFAALPLTVGGEDLQNVRVVTGKGLTIPGMLVAAGGSLPTDHPIAVAMMPVDMEMMMFPGMRGATVQPDGRFELAGVFGDAFIFPRLPRGWMAKSVSYRGADVTDKAIEFTADGGLVRIVVTNRLTVLTGTVSKRGGGSTVSDYELLVFSEDASRWQNVGRGVQVLRPDQQGVYKVEALTPGAYFVAAFDRLDDEARTSPEFLERVRAMAERVELEEGDVRTVNLPLLTSP